MRSKYILHYLWFQHDQVSPGDTCAEMLEGFTGHWECQLCDTRHHLAYGLRTLISYHPVNELEICYRDLGIDFYRTSNPAKRLKYSKDLVVKEHKIPFTMRGLIRAY